MEVLDEKQTSVMNRCLSHFSENFENTDNTTQILSPASFSLLGDHTHYNEGLLLSAAIDRYSAIVLRKRDDSNINVILKSNGAFSRLELGVRTKNILEDNLRELAERVVSKKMISSGFDCVLGSDIPLCVGLGRYSSYQTGFMKALNNEFELGMNDDEIVDFVHEAELVSLGKISNKAHHITTVCGKAGKLNFIDLRTGSCTPVDFPMEKYKIILCDTQRVITDIRDTCNSRIEECDVGVKGLKLYVWGVKSLRDINRDFLERHINMIPRLVYNRCLFNVMERQRVEEGKKLIEQGEYERFGTLLFDSHRSLGQEYSLTYPELNYLISQAEKSGYASGGKQISCSPIKATLNLVKEEKITGFIENTDLAYMKKYNKNLVFHEFGFVDGLSRCA